jgi:hypothetical protein
MINFLDFIHHPNFYLKQCFRNQALSLSAGKKPTLLDPINRAIPLDYIQNIEFVMFSFCDSCTC